jgi:hypothetical protein
MELMYADRKRAGQVVGVCTAVLDFTFSHTAPSEAGIINKSNSTNAVGILAGAVAAAAVGGAVVGSFGGPPGALALGTGAAAATVTSAVTYTVVTKTIEHPVAALQTAQAINPFTGPIYIATHSTSVVSGAKQFWNYLFN